MQHASYVSFTHTKQLTMCNVRSRRQYMIWNSARRWLRQRIMIRCRIETIDVTLCADVDIRQSSLLFYRLPKPHHKIHWRQLMRWNVTAQKDMGFALFGLWKFNPDIPTSVSYRHRKATYVKACIEDR